MSVPDDRDDDDRHVDEEDRSPPEVLEQVTAGDRADRHTDARDPRPDADGAAAFARREDVGEDRQRRRHDERGAEALDRARHDEDAGRSRERRRERAAAEDHEPDEQRRLAAVTVAGAARDQEEAREDERVRVDDPLELARRRAELAHEARQRDVDDRPVDADDQQAQTEHREDPPAPGVDGGIDQRRRACRLCSRHPPKPSSASRRTGPPRTLTAPGATQPMRSLVETV